MKRILPLCLVLAGCTNAPFANLLDRMHHGRLEPGVVPINNGVMVGPPVIVTPAPTAIPAAPAPPPAGVMPPPPATLPTPTPVSSTSTASPIK